MSPDQPTNQPTQPTVDETVDGSGPGAEVYLSLRLKVTFDKQDVILSKVLHDVPDYCMYKHTTSGEHFHVCLPGLGKSDTTRIGKRVRDNLGVSGNGGYSIKSFANGYHSFVFYSGHEGTPAIYEDAKWTPIVAACTKYYVKAEQSMLPLSGGKTKDQDADWQLTYGNMVSKAINHARRRALTGSLKEVLQDMMETTKWRPSYHLVKNGVPDHYYKDYEFRSGKRKKFDMSWMDVKSF